MILDGLGTDGTLPFTVEVGSKMVSPTFLNVTQDCDIINITQDCDSINITQDCDNNNITTDNNNDDNDDDDCISEAQAAEIALGMLVLGMIIGALLTLIGCLLGRLPCCHRYCRCCHRQQSDKVTTVRYEKQEDDVVT